MSTQYTAAMLRSIEIQIERCSQGGCVLDVYRAAETIRLENILEDVPLQDIVKRLVSEAGTRCAMEFIHDSVDGIVHVNSASPPLSNGKIA